MRSWRLPWQLRALAAAGATLLVSCLTSEDSYFEAARAQVMRGAIDACCPSHDVLTSVRKACEDDARVRCVFAEGATVQRVSFGRFGHDDGATVEVDVTGPRGRGRCTYQVVNWPRGELHVQSGGCAR